jgi:uroporphyrinogen-III synthase
MRVLVLRPERSARKTAIRLSSLGHQPVVLPLSEPRHDPDALRVALGKPHAAIAITSSEAARLLASMEAALEPHRRTTLFAVGHSSAQAARDAGFSAVLTSGGDGRDLADLILRHFADHAMPAGPVLYLAGNPRAATFESRMTEVAIPHRTVECYRMVPLAPEPGELQSALIEAVPDAVLFYSRESAKRFFALEPVAANVDVFLQTRFLCMSENVSQAVPPGFSATVMVSEKPDEESLLMLLPV